VIWKRRTSHDDKVKGSVGVDDPENTVGRLLPREIAPGILWLGDCMLWTGRVLEHSYTGVLLVSGSEHSLLIDTGHPKD
jgi:hypothetical protein